MCPATVRHAGDETADKLASGRDHQRDCAWAHAALLVDQAGWHLSSALTIPKNVTIVDLPARFPELNPQENVWQSMRNDWLSDRVFESYDDILDQCCYAWNTLIERPSRIMSSVWARRRMGSDQRELVSVKKVRFLKESPT